jgi:twitching motility protein PilT
MRDDLKKVMVEMNSLKASDLHITANSPMHYRINGELTKVSEKVLGPDETRDICYSMMNDAQIEKFEQEKEMEFSFSIEKVARYRITIFRQQSSVGAAVRMIPLEIMSIEGCGLPQNIVRQFCNVKQGLVLVTGPTGSGKSTTLAAMVHEINSTRDCHIVTVEDPIEFIHKNNKAIIDQRELYEDTHSFGNALKHVLRQDPDVILIGELRDLETISHAMTIADTGHLVLGTLHTPDCVQTINRIVDIFPPYQQKQTRIQLSFVLAGMLAQQLIPNKDSSGMVLATEILIATPAIRSMIREAKEHQIYSAIQTSQRLGMRTMNQALASLYSEGVISYERAVSRSMDVEEFMKLTEKMPEPAKKK